MASPTTGIAAHPDIRTCTFSGGSAGDGPATWAQQFVWEEIRRTNGANYDVYVVARDPDPIDVDDALRRMAEFVVRHPVLRACILAEPDGVLHQRVVASGSFAVRVEQGSSAITGTEIRALAPPIDDTFPCRGLIVVEDGRVVIVALRVSHVVIDQWGIGLLRSDLARSMRGQRRSVEEAETRSPLDVARVETSAGGAGEQDKALAYAAQVLRSAPPTLFPGPRRAAEAPRYWNGELRSSAIPRALDTLYSTRRLLPAGVVMGALAMVVAARAHTDAALTYVTSGNRVSADVQSYPGQMAQEGMFVLPVSGYEAAEVMRAASRRSMAAFRWSRFDPARLDALLREIEHERGMWIDKMGTSLAVNFTADTRSTTRATSAPGRTGPTVFEWTSRTNQDFRFMFAQVSSTDDEYIIRLRIDTAVLAPAEVETMARTVEWVITEMVDRPVGLADVARRLGAVAEDGSLVRHQGGLMNLDVCEELVRAATSLSDVHLRLETAVEGHGELVCYLHDPAGSASPEVLHREVMVRVLESPGSVAPSRYVLLADPLGGTRGLGEWIATARVTQAGSGRG